MHAKEEHENDFEHPPTVVFDLGGVLLDWSPRYLYSTVFEDDAQLSWFLREVIPLEWISTIDEGKPWDEAIAERQARFPELAEEIALFRDRWPETLRGTVDRVEEVLHALCDEGQVYALTNFSRETFAWSRDTFPFLNRFAGILVSAEVGLKKPDLAIYRAFEERFALAPSRLVFIDDRPDNIAAAKEAGWDGIVFQDAVSLRDALVRRGLLVSQP